MNSYSKFKALAGVNSIYYNITDDNNNIVATIKSYPDNDFGTLQISGIVDNIQRGEIFEILNFGNVEIETNDEIKLSTNNIVFNTANTFNVIGPDQSSTIAISPTDDQNKFSKLSLAAAGGFIVNTDSTKPLNELNTKDSSVVINSVSDVLISGNKLKFNNKELLTQEYTIKQVEFLNKATSPTNGQISWKFEMKDGIYYDPIEGDKPAENITFKKMPIMQIVGINGNSTSGTLKLAEMTFNTSLQALSVVLDNVSGDIPMNTYKITLIGY